MSGRKADNLFSELIKEMAFWRCECCGRDMSEQKKYYDCAHFCGRWKEATRFEIENCLALCRSCHVKFHKDKRAHKEFMVNKLGEEKVDWLILQSNQHKDRDDVTDYEVVKSMYSEKMLNKEMYGTFNPNERGMM